MLENGSFSKKASVFLICLLLFLPLYLQASVTGDRIENQPDEVSRYVLPLRAVTVTGSRLPVFDVPFADVPVNISYVPFNASRKDREAAHRNYPRSLQDAVTDLESVVLYDDVGNGLDTTVGLRGFNESSAVIVLVDGVRVNEVDGGIVRYPLISMTDLEALQLDRGSASPIYGSNAFAGVLHLTTGRPSDAPLTVFGGTEYSFFDGMNAYSGIKGTVQDRLTPIGGALGYYFKAGRSFSDGFRENGQHRITDFDIKTEYYLPDEQGRFFNHVKRLHDKLGNPGALTFQQYQIDPSVSVKDRDGRELDMTSVALGGDLRFLEDRLTASLLASARYTHVGFVTTSATFTDFADSFNPDTDHVDTEERSTDLIWQLAYQDEWKDFLNQTVLGMEFHDGAAQSLERDYFEGYFRPTAAETDRLSSSNGAALFWRGSLNYADHVILHAGMRHDYAWLETRDNLTNTGTDNRWRDSTLSTGITVRPADPWDIFFNYSQGFRVPTISEIAPFSGTISTGLQPEKSDSYETGTRLRLKDKAEVKLSGFIIDVKDEILFDSTSITASAPFGQNTNAGKTRRGGIEMRLDAKPVEEIETYAAYTWTRAWIRESNPSGSVVDGRSLGQIPEHRWTAGVTARPLQRWGERLAGFRIGLYGTFTGSQHPQSYESASQTVLNATGGAGHRIKPYSVWDLVLSYACNGAEIYFKINNLFNEKYYSRAVSATSFGTAIQPAGTFSFVNPGAPREFVLGARWEFDTFTDFLTNRSGNPE